jgi:hypothetical protein
MYHDLYDVFDSYNHYQYYLTNSKKNPKSVYADLNSIWQSKIADQDHSRSTGSTLYIKNS